MKSSVIEEIRKQKGLDDFKNLVARWDVLSQNMTAVPGRVPIILPDIFLVSRSGAGRTHFLKLLTSYLEEKGNLIDFYGDVKYFEFMLSYCAPERDFTEIQRLMQEVSNAGGFRSEYRGIIFIDLEEWNGHFEEKHFISFMEYLSANSDDWLIVLSVSGKSLEEVTVAESVISSFLRTERINIEEPTASELIAYVERKIAAYGLTLKLDAKELIFDSFKVLCRNKYFDGYKTAKILAQDIAYYAYSSESCVTLLSREDVYAFRHDGEYIQKMMLKKSLV